MSQYVPGLVIIINESVTRPGSERDVELLEKTFIMLNATVQIWSFTGEEKPGEYKNKVKEKFKILKGSKEIVECEYVAIVHCSHGTANGQVYDAKGVSYHIQNLFLKPLYNVKALENKLKWLIVQACRGENETRMEQATADGAKGYYTNFVLKSYSSSEGGISQRNVNGGAIYIEKLCAELEKSAGEKDLVAILEDTAESVKNYFIEFNKNKKPAEQKFQEPEKAKNFSNKFFFTQGLLPEASSSI